MKKYPPTSKELRDWMDSKGLSNKDVANGKSNGPRKDDQAGKGNPAGKADSEGRADA